MAVAYMGRGRHIIKTERIRVLRGGPKMQMELLKKPIKSYRTIDIRETEEMLENSIIVPDSKPDVRNILVADAECFVTNVEKSGRMIEVSGEIRYRILYCADTPEQRMECIITRYPWSFSVQKPKNEGEIGVFAKCRCQHSEANAVNGRKIVARTVVSLVCRFYEIKSDEIGREILGENVFLKTSPINVVSLKDNGSINARVSNILSLPNGSPAIKEVLFSHVNLGHADVSYREEEPCLEAKGTVNLLYRSDTMDESIESVVLEFPVKTNIGVNAGADNTIFASNNLRSWDVEVLEDNDGLNTQVSVNMEVEVEAQAMVHEEQTIIEDAYSVEYSMALNKNTLSVVADEKEFCEFIEINQKINLGMGDVHLEEVFMVCANERNISVDISDRNVNVHGTIGADVVYLLSNKEVNSHSEELPFAQTFILPDNGLWQIVESCFSIEDVCFDILGGNTIEIRVKLKIKLRAAKYMDIVCTDGLNLTKEEANKKAPIILYFAQPNDTMWSVAKQYRVPLNKLAMDNGMEDAARLEAGKRLFIMG